MKAVSGAGDSELDLEEKILIELFRWGSGRCYVTADTELRMKKRDPYSVEPSSAVRIGGAESQGKDVALQVRETTAAPCVAL